MPFIANTDEQRRQMLGEIGMTPADLFAAIPQELRAGPLRLPEQMPEQKVRAHMADLAARSDLLEPVHQVTLERNTIAGGQTMVVYRAHWRR